MRTFLHLVAYLFFVLLLSNQANWCRCCCCFFFSCSCCVCCKKRVLLYGVMQVLQEESVWFERCFCVMSVCWHLRIVAFVCLLYWGMCVRTRILLLLLTGQACCCRSLSLLPAAVGDCYSQDVFSCKVDKFSNRNQCNRSLRELAQVAFEFRNYLCGRCSQRQPWMSTVHLLLILCCCFHGHFFHSSLSYVFWIASDAVAGLLARIHLSCLPENIRVRWIFHTIWEQWRKIRLSVPLLLLVVSLSKGANIE